MGSDKFVKIYLFLFHKGDPTVSRRLCFWVLVCYVVPNKKSL